MKLGSKLTRMAIKSAIAKDYTIQIRLISGEEYSFHISNRNFLPVVMALDCSDLRSKSGILWSGLNIAGYISLIKNRSVKNENNINKKSF